MELLFKGLPGQGLSNIIIGVAARHALAAADDDVKVTVLTAAGTGPAATVL